MAVARLHALEDEMKKCFRCSLCKMIPLPVITNPAYSDGCPANREYHAHGYSGSGKSITALSLLEGRIPADAALANMAFACTTCGLCDVSCKFIMDSERQLINIALREHLVDEGLGPPAHRKIIERMGSSSYGDTLSGEYKKLASDLNLKLLPEEKADVLLLPGLSYNGEADVMESLEKLSRILLECDVDVGIFHDTPQDSGLFAYWTGYRDIFTTIAQKNASIINELDIYAVITVSGADLGILRSKYPEYGIMLKPQVFHASEYLDTLIKQGKLRLPLAVKKKVTYHDPCYLGRQSEPPHNWSGEKKMTHGCMTYYQPSKPINTGVNGVFDQPRNIIRSVRGIDFVEMHRIREYAFCCGGGGGVPEAYPNFAKNTALHRVDEAISVGADCIVTSCHQCRRNLSISQNARSGPSLPVIDIIDLVFEAADIKK